MPDDNTHIEDIDVNEICAQCGEFAGVETSPEGQNCAICDDWICDDCEDAAVSGEHGSICRLCSKEHDLKTCEEAEAYLCILRKTG